MLVGYKYSCSFVLISAIIVASSIPAFSVSVVRPMDDLGSSVSVISVISGVSGNISIVGLSSGGVIGNSVS